MKMTWKIFNGCQRKVDIFLDIRINVETFLFLSDAVAQAMVGIKLLFIRVERVHFLVEIMLILEAVAATFMVLPVT